MIVVCPACNARYKFDEAKLGGRPKAKTKCAKCGGVIEIVNPGAEPEAPATNDAPPPSPPPLPPAEPQKKSDTKKIKTFKAEGGDGGTDPGGMTGRDIEALLELPKDKRFSLAVIQGEATGQIFPISKVRTTIGRTEADITIEDAEASRQHAVLEILGENAILRDLDSTNGTFIDNARIQQEVLQNHMEFRIGGHVLMFIVTAVE
jgi:predicted Zn finger-like uncharacterized protein